MIWQGPDSPRQQSHSKAETDVLELRIVAVCYTYFGWFPWSDFDGESFSEEKVYELTGRRPLNLDAKSEEIEWLEDRIRG